MDMFRIAFSVIVILFAVIDRTIAIKCYYCTVQPILDINSTEQHLCQDFEETDYFVKDCPYSTMCMKKVFKYELLDGHMVETVSRNCANQKFTEQVFKDGRWIQEITIEKPYEAGCETNKDAGQGTSTIYCHCHGSYCNSSTKEVPSYHTDAMAVIFVFNAMKYLRNID